MSAALSSPIECCNQCPEDGSEVDPVQLPGPKGDIGLDGDDGCSGVNAYTIVQAPGFVQPAVNGEVTITVGQSVGFGIGAPTWVETGGTYSVVSKPTTTSIRIKNLGYSENAAPTTAIAAGVRMTQSGWKGAAGPSASGDLLAANDLSDLDNPTTTALDNIGGTTAGKALFKLANPSAITFLRVNADNTVTALSASAFRTALTLVPGTDIQAFDAFLLSIATLGTAADRIIYTTGVNVAAETVITAYARTLIDDADAATARTTLGVISNAWAVYQNQQAAGVDGGTFNNGAWQTVPLNTEALDVGAIGGLAANIVTLIAGTYRFRGRLVVSVVNKFQSRLYNVDTAAVIAYGECLASTQQGKVSEVIGRFTIAIATQVRLEGQCETSLATSGFGAANAFGGTQVYSSLEFWRE